MKIAIASGKGGAGKTTLATNLSMLMAETQEVILVDMDVEEPDASLFFDFEPSVKIIDKMIPVWDATNCTSCGKCQEVCNFNAIINLLDEIVVFPELCHSCHACAILCPESALTMEGKRMGEMRFARKGRLALIENRLDVGEEQPVPLISKSLEYLERTFDDDKIVIMDAPPGTSCPVIEVTLDADLVILVAEPTPFGLNDLKITVETMKLLERDFAVVINRDGMGNDELEKYCHSNGISIIAKIPYSRKAAELYSAGHLMLDGIPEVREEIIKVRDYILSRKKEKTT